MSAVIILVLIAVVVVLLFWIYGDGGPSAERGSAGSRVTVATHQNLTSALHLIEKKVKSDGCQWDRLVAMVALVGGLNDTLRRSRNLSNDVLRLWAMRGGNKEHYVKGAVQSAWPIYQEMLERGLTSESLATKMSESSDWGVPKDNLGVDAGEKPCPPSKTPPVQSRPNGSKHVVRARRIEKRSPRLPAWIKDKVARKGAQVAANEMTRYINYLRGGDDDDVSMILLFATLARENLLPQNYEEQCLSSRLGGGPPDPDTALQFQGELLRTYKQLQRANDLEMASALAVWVHTNRAFCYPEVRYLGRELWAQLSRGFPHLESCANDMRTFGGVPIPDRVLRVARNIPLALKPQE